jgi:hypothetical protein
MKFLWVGYEALDESGNNVYRDKITYIEIDESGNNVYRDRGNNVYRIIER